MGPLKLSSLAGVAVKCSILEALSSKWTVVWLSGQCLPFRDNCVKFVKELEEILWFLDDSGNIPVSVTCSLYISNVLKHIAKSMSCPEVWCIHAHDVRPSVAIWYSDPSKFARLFVLEPKL